MTNTTNATGKLYSKKLQYKGQWVNYLNKVMKNPKSEQRGASVLN